MQIPLPKGPTENGATAQEPGHDVQEVEAEAGEEAAIPDGVEGEETEDGECSNQEACVMLTCQ